MSQQASQSQFIIIFVSVDYRMSTQVIRPVRSISYNDIKKRRLLRQSKSKGKLKSTQASTEIVHTEKKVYPNKEKDIYASQRPNQIQQIKQALIKKCHNSEEVKNTIKKKNKISVVNFTERVQANKEKQNNSRIQNQEKRMNGAHSKQIVRQLIEQSKSQRKLLKYNDLRNKFKLSKSRSRSKSAKSLLEKSKILAKRFIQIDITPQKPVSSPIKGIKNSNRIKRFQSVHQGQNTKSKPNFRYLVSVPKQRDCFFKGANKNTNYIQDAVQSSIQAQRQSSFIGSIEDKKIIQQICNKKKQEIIFKEIKQNNLQQQQKFLDLLDAQPSELYKYFGKKQRQKKIANDLEKLNKKFPKGFFKI